METITMAMRLKYLHNVFNETNGLKITFHEFMEVVFTHLETECRVKDEKLIKLFREGEGKKLPINQGNQLYKYDYER